MSNPDIKSIGAAYTRTFVITDADHPDLDKDETPPILVITNSSDALWVEGNEEQLARIGAKIHAATTAAFPERSRIRFTTQSGRPEPVCPCGNGNPALDGIMEWEGFYLGDDAGKYAGRLGRYTTIVCCTCGRAGTFPQAPLTIPAGSPDVAVVPGFGHVIAVADAATILEADELSPTAGDWRV